ncbi:MAG: hypothetical protein Ct9H300mP11_32800 [Chloroflexota bacterium]|nr:MAG: hypothetical protein Ct9H300mP11_32800 [Chloroflexota bacterium]
MPFYGGTWEPVKGRPAPTPSGVTYQEEPVHGNVYTWGEDVLVSGEYGVSRYLTTTLPTLVVSWGRSAHGCWSGLEHS